MGQKYYIITEENGKIEVKEISQQASYDPGVNSIYDVYTEEELKNLFNRLKEIFYR